MNGIAYGLGFAWTKVSGWWNGAISGMANYIKSFNWAGAGAWVMSLLRTALVTGWGAIKAWWEGGWPGLINYVKGLNWSSVGMFIADALTFGLASKINGANWGGIIQGAVAAGKSAFSGWGAGTAAAAGAPPVPGKPAPPIAGKRAFGGPVRAGKTYLVGERGRELFTPNVGGSITPNNKLHQPVAARTSSAPAPTVRVQPRITLGGRLQQPAPPVRLATPASARPASFMDAIRAMAVPTIVRVPAPDAERPQAGSPMAEASRAAVQAVAVKVIMPSATQAAAPVAPAPAQLRDTQQAGKQIVVQPGGIVINGVSDTQGVERAVERVLTRIAGENDRYYTD